MPLLFSLPFPLFPFFHRFLVSFFTSFDVFVGELGVAVACHAALYDGGLVGNITGRPGGVALQRGRVAGRDEGGLARAQVFRAAMEIVLRGGLGTVNPRPHFYDIQIDFHDALLRPESLNQKGVVGLKPFADPRASGPAEHILGRLLRDGAATAFPDAVFALLQGHVQGDDIKSVVPQEIVVLRSDGRLVHVGRNLLKGLPGLLNRIAVLDFPNHHKRRDRRIDPAEDDGEKDAQQKKQEDDQAKNLPKSPFLSFCRHFFK